MTNFAQPQKLGELLIDPACLVLRLERGLVLQPFQPDHVGFLRVFAFPDLENQYAAMPSMRRKVRARSAQIRTQAILLETLPTKVSF
jgi:hypothetical protein